MYFSLICFLMFDVIQVIEVQEKCHVKIELKREAHPVKAKLL